MFAYPKYLIFIEDLIKLNCKNKYILTSRKILRSIDNIETSLKLIYVFRITGK